MLRKPIFVVRVNMSKDVLLGRLSKMSNDLHDNLGADYYILIVPDSTIETTFAFNLYNEKSEEDFLILQTKVNELIKLYE